MPFAADGPFATALVYAHAAHATQLRKGTQVPYVAHLLAVAALALEQGADEDVAVAALLHDTVEDQGGAPRLAEIRARFGERVAALVEACTDADTVPKPAWKPRKEKYLAHLVEAGDDVRLIVLCDKLHNLTSMLRDYREVGPELWARFKPTPIDILWYYRSVLEILAAKGSLPLLHELRAKVAELAGIVAAS